MEVWHLKVEVGRSPHGAAYDHFVVISKDVESAQGLLMTWEDLEGNGAPRDSPLQMMPPSQVSAALVLTQDDPEVWTPLTEEILQFRARGYLGAVYGRDEIILDAPDIVEPGPEPAPKSDEPELPESTPEPDGDIYVLKKKRASNLFFLRRIQMDRARPDPGGQVLWTSRIGEAKTYDSLANAKRACGVFRGLTDTVTNAQSIRVEPVLRDSWRPSILRECYRGPHVLLKKRTKKVYFKGKRDGKVEWVKVIEDARVYLNYKSAKIAASKLRNSSLIYLDPLPLDGVARILPSRKGLATLGRLAPGVHHLEDGRVRVRVSAWDPIQQRSREKATLMAGGLGLPAYRAEKSKLEVQVRMLVLESKGGDRDHLDKSVRILLGEAIASVGRVTSRAAILMDLAEAAGDQEAIRSLQSVLGMFPAGSVDKRNPGNR